MKHETVRNEANDQGFTMTPHSVFDWLLLQNLKKRELKLALLIIRLTYGCHRDWAELRQADLAAIGITAGHAREVIESALSKKIIIKNGSLNQYRVYVPDRHQEKTAARLRKLIGNHSYQKSNPKITKTVTADLPKEEVYSYENGNTENLPKAELSRSENAYASQPKHTDKNSLKISDKDRAFADKKIIDLTSFTPSNAAEAAAFDVWQQLEPTKPETLRLYLSFARRGLSADMFYRFSSEIKQDPTVRNMGALFNRKAVEFCKTQLVTKVGADG